MPTATINGELWGARARDWAQRQEPAVVPLWRAMLEAAGVGSGTRLLDVACGAGGAARLARERGATVTGIDASPALTAIAAESIDGTFLTGEMEELPFPDGSFDVVTATNALQYAADRVRAARELRRVVTPDGRVVVGMWAESAKNEMAGVFTAVRTIAPPPPGTAQPLDLAERANLLALLVAAGLRAVRDEEVPCLFHYADDEAYWIAQRSAGVMEAVARRVGEDALRAALRDVAAPYTNADGSVSMRNTMRYVLAVPA